MTKVETSMLMFFFCECVQILALTRSMSTRAHESSILVQANFPMHVYQQGVSVKQTKDPINFRLIRVLQCLHTALCCLASEMGRGWGQGEGNGDGE